MIWNRDQIKALIECVEVRECLWNMKSALYHNQPKRHEANVEISSEINISPEDIKKKIHTLRAQFTKERSKINQSKSGSGASEVYKPKWECFDLLQFMFRHCDEDSQITTDSMDNNSTLHTPESAVEEKTDSDDINKYLLGDVRTRPQESPTINSRPSTSTTTTSSGSVRSKAKKRKLDNLTSAELQEQAAMNRCLSIMSNAKPKEEFSIFGEDVAQELRSLQNALDLQIKLKHLIQKSILDISYELQTRQFGPEHPVTSNNSTSVESQKPPWNPNSQLMSPADVDGGAKDSVEFYLDLGTGLLVAQDSAYTSDDSGHASHSD